MLWPPALTRLPPTNTTVASAYTRANSPRVAESVVLEVAEGPDPVRGRADLPRPVGVGLGLHEEEIHFRQHPAEQPPHRAVAPERARGDPPVHDHDPHPAAVGFMNEVGPDLRL